MSNSGPNSIDLNRHIQDLIRAELQLVLPDLLTELLRSAVEEDGFVDTREAARLTGLSRQFFECGRSTRNPNQPRHYKIGRRVLYRRTELIEWIRRRAES